MYSLAESATGQPLLFESYRPAEDVDAVRRGAPADDGAVHRGRRPRPVRGPGLLAEPPVPAVGQAGAAWHQAQAAAVFDCRRTARTRRQGAVQGLAGAAYALDTLAPQLSGRARDLIEGSSSAVRAELATFQHLADDLESAPVRTSDVVAELERLLRRLSDVWLWVARQVPADLEVPWETASLLVRLVDELTAGAVSERPRRVRLVLTHGPGAVLLTVAVDVRYQSGALDVVRAAVDDAAGQVRASAGRDGMRGVEVELPVP